MTILSTILFFLVFIQLFLALSLYLGNTLYGYYTSGKKKAKVEEEGKQRDESFPS